MSLRTFIDANYPTYGNWGGGTFIAGHDNLTDMVAEVIIEFDQRVISQQSEGVTITIIDAANTTSDQVLGARILNGAVLSVTDNATGQSFIIDSAH